MGVKGFPGSEASKVQGVVGGGRNGRKREAKMRGRWDNLGLGLVELEWESGCSLHLLQPSKRALEPLESSMKSCWRPVRLGSIGRG